MSQPTDSESLLKLVIVIAAVVILAPAILMLLMVPLAGGMMMSVPRTGGFAFVGLLMMLVVPLLLIAAIVILYRQWRDRDREDEALRELRLAFARGEIDREEFEERREALLQGERVPTDERRNGPDRGDEGQLANRPTEQGAGQ